MTERQAPPDDDLALPSVAIADEGRTADEVIKRLTVTVREHDTPMLENEIAKVHALRKRRISARFVGILSATQLADYRRSIMQVPAPRHAEKSVGVPDWND